MTLIRLFLFQVFFWSWSTLINLVWAMALIRQGKKHRSPALAADGHHLMTDVITSLGVIVGLVMVKITGIRQLDPVIALVVAANIVWTGIGLLRTSIDGLLDRALPEEDQRQLRSLIMEQLEPDATFHALRTRKAGSRRFVDFHLLLPGEISVQHAHDLTHKIEDAVKTSFPYTETTVHIEPIEEQASWEDSVLVSLEPRLTSSVAEMRRFSHQPM